jgi:hypothetical protein
MHGRRGVRVGAPGSRKRLPVRKSIPSKSALEVRRSIRNKNARLLSIEAGQRVEFTVLWADGVGSFKADHRHQQSSSQAQWMDMASLARLEEHNNDFGVKVKREFY